MVRKVDFNTVLVPIDFSEHSRVALEQAFALVEGESPVIILLHVLDPAFAEFAELHGLAQRDDIMQRMRQEAQNLLQEYVAARPDDVEIDTIISEGPPFLEILQKADDFAVDAIVMGKVGRRGKFEKLLFGSTAEKVIRGSDKPVLVLASGD